jgi:hypothetical protein
MTSILSFFVVVSFRNMRARYSQCFAAQWASCGIAGMKVVKLLRQPHYLGILGVVPYRSNEPLCCLA